MSIPEKVLLAIRPFYVGISLEESGHFNIPAEVFVVEPMGDMTVVIVNVNGARLQVVTVPEFTAITKQNVWLSLDPDHILLFDVNTGQAIVSQAA